jgi:peptide/nickel transport system permease protein
MVTPMLSLRDLHTHFTVEGEIYRAVDGLDLDIAPGEAVALVGESGSGKTVTAMSILQLIPDPPGRIVGGSVRLDGEELLGSSAARLREVRGGRIACVFQDPQTTLNPVLKVGAQIVEMIRAHSDASRPEARKRALELLQAVHILNAQRVLDEYPHQLSGGMRQRVVIAMALANNPDLLIADEPTTALDVTVQAEILDLLMDLRERMGMALLFITHDLGVVAELCDRVVVMYAGRAVEEAPTRELFANPQHPYTRQLIACTPRLGGGRRDLATIPGLPPALNNLSPGCAFAPRCDVAQQRCRETTVDIVEVATQHSARCLRPGVTP